MRATCPFNFVYLNLNTPEIRKVNIKLTLFELHLLNLCLDEDAIKRAVRSSIHLPMKLGLMISLAVLATKCYQK